MTYSPPNQRTWSVGDIATAAEMNANVRDSVNFLNNTPKARMTISGAFSLSNATWMQITGGATNFTVDYDPYSLWSNASSVFYFDQPGVWDLRARAYFASNSTGIRGVGFAVSASTVDTGRQITISATGGNIYAECTSSVYIPNTSNQYVRLMVYQNSGSTMTLGALGEFTVAYRGAS